MNQRNVSFSRLLKLMFSESKLTLIGLILALFAAVVLFPVFSIPVSKLKSELSKYDYSTLDNVTTEYKAKVINLEVQYNININGRHPLKITYQFNYDGKERTDEFTTLEMEKLEGIYTDSEITVIADGEKSKIKGFKNPDIPVGIIYVFYVFPTMVLIVGLVLLIVGFVKALKVSAIYKKGIVRDGIIELFIPSKNKIIVTYSYDGSNDEKLSGKTLFKSNEILNIKKMKDPVKVFVLPGNELKSVMVPPNNEWGI